MTFTDIADMIAEIAEKVGCDYAYYPDTDPDVVHTPYILFQYTGTDNLSADNAVYAKIVGLQIELDTDTKDIEKESIVESVLDTYGLYYNSEEGYISSHNVHETMWSMEVLINGSK